MGDISIIARRLPDANSNYVQYGWSGNGGYFKNVGIRLITFCQTPELVDYLFSLGDIKLIGAPYSEKGGYEKYSISTLYDEYRFIYNCFDNW